MGYEALTMADTARVRFAPSPTGQLHLGSALVALANRAYAAASGGVMVLRIDDTDRVRSTADAVEGILAVLEWLGIGYEEGPRFQRTRDDVYREHLDRLVDERLAYHCFCTQERLDDVRSQQRAAGQPPRYDGRCRGLAAAEVERRRDLGEQAVVRLRVPRDQAYGFEDLVRGAVAAPPDSFGDFVLRRSDGSFGYLFASACDDADMDISHVIRGEDHLPNTPRQLAILDALGASPPVFAHLPLLHSPAGGKLAKRDHLGSVDELRREGWLPRTVRRYLAELLGQGAVDLLDPGVTFDLARVPSTSPVVDEARLASLGREDLAVMDDDSVCRELASLGYELQTHERELMRELVGGTPTPGALRAALARLRTRPAPPDEPFASAELEVIEECFARVREAATDGLAGWAEEPAEILAGLRAWGASRNLPVRSVLQPLRRALTGEIRGPAMPAVLLALGPEETLHRLSRPLDGMTSQVSG